MLESYECFEITTLGKIRQLDEDPNSRLPRGLMGPEANKGQKLQLDRRMDLYQLQIALRADSDPDSQKVYLYRRVLE